MRGLPGPAGYLEAPHLPFGNLKKIEQTVHFEIESYIPFEMEQVVIDYAVVWQTKEASRVMVVYVQKGELAKTQ
jgi:Tfp pilus assembly PilM family ATPase